MLNPEQKKLVEFVQKYAPLLPLAERIQVYRGLSDFSDSQELISSLAAKARILERAELECAELNLSFPPKTNDGKDGAK